MNCKGVTGRKIVAVVQSRFRTNSGVQVVVDRIVLDNGTTLIPAAYECENHGPIGDIMANRLKRRSKGGAS
jgi:hypothetical protein